MSTHKKFYVGAKGLIVKDETVLLLWSNRNGRQFWDMPGGKIHDDEVPTEALMRELSEELPNMKDVNLGQLLYAHRIPHDVYEDMGLFLTFYEVQADFDGDVEHSDEHEKYAWMHFDDIERHTLPEVIGAVRAYKERMRGRNI